MCTNEKLQIKAKQWGDNKNAASAIHWSELKPNWTFECELWWCKDEKTLNEHINELMIDYTAYEYENWNWMVASYIVCFCTLHYTLLHFIDSEYVVVVMMKQQKMKKNIEVIEIEVIRVGTSVYCLNINMRFYICTYGIELHVYTTHQTIPYVHKYDYER